MDGQERKPWSDAVALTIVLVSFAGIVVSAIGMLLLELRD